MGPKPWMRVPSTEWHDEQSASYFFLPRTFGGTGFFGSSKPFAANSSKSFWFITKTFVSMRE